MVERSMKNYIEIHESFNQISRKHALMRQLSHRKSTELPHHLKEYQSIFCFCQISSPSPTFFSRTCSLSMFFSPKTPLKSLTLFVSYFHTSSMSMLVATTCSESSTTTTTTTTRLTRDSSHKKLTSKKSKKSTSFCTSLVTFPETIKLAKLERVILSTVDYKMKKIYFDSKMEHLLLTVDRTSFPPWKGTMSWNESHSPSIKCGLT